MGTHGFVWAAELVCGQLVRGVAKSTWGEDKPPGKPDPRWLIKCRQCLGYSMKEFVSEEREWDAYIIGTIQMAHLRDFLPDGIRDDDAACEMHRCVKHACVDRLTIRLQGSSAPSGLSA